MQKREYLAKTTSRIALQYMRTVIVDEEELERCKGLAGAESIADFPDGVLVPFDTKVEPKDT